MKHIIEDFGLSIVQIAFLCGMAGLFFFVINLVCI